MIEFFEHTADLGLRIRAADLDGLFAEAARRCFPPSSRTSARSLRRNAWRSASRGTDREFLLFDWLKTLLYHFDAEHLLFWRFEARVRRRRPGRRRLGRADGPDAARADHEVKAITYHGLKVEQTPDGWLAEVIVDI